MRLILVTVFITLSTVSVMASEQIGIAFAKSPDSEFGICTHLTDDQALACARLKCVADGGNAESCRPSKWCFPSGWSAHISLLHNEGVNWSEFTCGWATREAALAAAAVACDRKHRDFVVDCSVVQIYDPAGKPQLN